MVKEKLEPNMSRISVLQKDMIHFELLIGDLMGILTKSISFCVHSSEAINRLIEHYLGNNKDKNEKNDEDSTVIMKEPPYILQSSIETNKESDEEGNEYIRFTNSGALFSLPKRIVNSLVGSYILEQSCEEQRTNDGNIYLDYPYDDSCASLLIDSLMNKKMNVDSLKISDQIKLIQLFEFCNLPLPEECVKSFIRIQNSKKYEEGDDIILYINEKKEDKLRDYLKRNGLWNNYVNKYNDGYVDYNDKKNELCIQMNYQYIQYIYDYILNSCMYISENEMKKINKIQLEIEMYNLFGDQGRVAVEEALIPFENFCYSRILTNRNMDYILNKWLGMEKKWKLLFRASEHDYSAKEFHNYCDDEGETVTLIKHIGHNNCINIFGGYTDHSWTDSERWYSYSKEFLFTLSNEHGIPPTKYDYTNRDRSQAIFCHPSFGPVFGDGFDISISDQCHTYNTSYCNAMNYREINTTQKSSLFVNTQDCINNNYFIVEDYEVWGRM
ncbi:hypothetical protein WA158_006781 [Blastocystis sp. Blastoise]